MAQAWPGSPLALWLFALILAKPQRFQRLLHTLVCQTPKLVVFLHQNRVQHLVQIPPQTDWLQQPSSQHAFGPHDLQGLLLISPLPPDAGLGWPASQQAASHVATGSTSSWEPFQNAALSTIFSSTDHSYSGFFKACFSKSPASSRSLSRVACVTLVAKPGTHLLSTWPGASGNSFATSFLTCSWISNIVAELKACQSWSLLLKKTLKKHCQTSRFQTVSLPCDHLWQISMFRSRANLTISL